MAKPRLGQHFLKDQSYLAKILKAADVGPEDAVIEVGPGKGILTKALCRQAGLVLALELDERLADGLHERLGHLDNLEIRKTDARFVDWNQLGLELNDRGYKQLKLVSNLPYYLATQMVIHALAAEHGVSRLVVMIQEEVGRRMVAEAGHKDYGAYSVAIRYYAEARYICTVPSKAFNPPPKVSSAVVCLDKRPSPALHLDNEEGFFYLVHAMFNHRRKTLRKCLTGAKGVPEQGAWDKIINQAKLDPTQRPETLSMEDLGRLYQETISL